MIEIRSYRRVFDLERRIYSVDHLRLNPAGVPVRGVVYFGAILATLLVTAALPLSRTLLRELPWYLSDVVLPGAGATLLSLIRVEGRTFHLAGRALLRHLVEPCWLAGVRWCAPLGTRWHPREIVILPDGSDSRMRGLRYTGPGAVLVLVEHERRGRAIERGSSAAARPGFGPVLTLSQSQGARRLERGEVISLAPGARMRVRSDRMGGG